MKKRLISIFACAFSLLNADIPLPLQGLGYAVYQPAPGQPDLGYGAARFNYNKRFNVFPLAIFSPPSSPSQTDAIFVLTQFLNYNLSFSVRGGGHCYEPGSLSSQYIFQLSGMTDITFDVPNQQVTIGAGCTLDTVINTLGAAGYAIPTGTCGTVGVAGLTLGGGIGFLGRTYGLTCDYVHSFTLLTADASIIHVNKNNYPDLFWALCGGGNGSYGIVLDITFNLLTVPDVCYYTITFQWNPNTAPQIFEAAQNWIQTLPDNISAIINTAYSYGVTTLSIEGLKVGSDPNSNPFTEWLSAFARFKPDVMTTYGNYYDVSKSWVGNDTIPFRKVTSNILVTPISKKGIKKIYNFIDNLRKNQAQTEFVFQVEALGGKIAQSNTPSTLTKGFAWMYQPTAWNLQDQGSAAMKISSQFHSLVSSYVSKYAYGNTTDYSLGTYFLTAYFGDNASRLINIKNKYDPNNIFNWQQSIPEPSPASVGSQTQLVPGSLICQ